MPRFRRPPRLPGSASLLEVQRPYRDGDRRFTVRGRRVRTESGNGIGFENTIRVSEASLRKIEQNLFWALGYDRAMIPLASVGLLLPVLAAAAMSFSSVSVLANSLLFRGYTPDHDYRVLGYLRR